MLTAYDSVYNTVTDQAGKSRKSEVDALGRLIKVFEDPQGLNYETSYDYDALGNLRQVTQGAQASRIFVYSSLSRLSSASNPESGMLQYEYDANGNLTTKTDARGVITSHGYDGLNRVVSRTYSDGTPAVTYTYDTLANGKGRLSSVSSTVSATNYISYDVLGRVTASSQVTNGQTYNFSYSYDLPGNLRYQTYPSGKVIETEYDSAGRMAGMKKQNGGYYAGGASTDTANKPQYSAHGAITALKLGNGLWEHTAFNSRLQPTEIGLGTTSADSSKLQLSYSYGTTANNGNVQSQVIVAAGLNLTQTYTYDALNRLKTFSETGGLTQTYDYDRWGNRAVTAGYTDPLAKMPTLTSLNDFKANNRIKSYDDNNWYDAAGNLKQIPGHSYAFDAENRMTSHDDSQTVGTIDDRYSYDGDGRRVKKVAGTVTTVFVYNAMGQMVAEYTDDSNPSPTSGTSYFTADNLGTPRVITNQQQGVISRHDYLPFGEEIKAGTGGRTTGQGYVDDADGVKQKFTQKERDAETGLDYFLARYYSSAQGRFTSVDPTLESMKLANPQTFNRYTYALNNPLRYIDPDGQIPVETAIDIVSLAHSFYDLIRNPSFTTAAFFVWDIAATIIPYAPGSYVAKGIKLSREAVEWSAKIGKTGYRGLRAEGIVDFTGKATKLADEFEATVNNKLVEAGIGLLGQGDDSVRRVLGMRAGDRAADFLGVTRGGSFLVGEAKGTDMVSAVIQLDNTIKALEGKLGAVKATPYLFLRRETNIQGNFKIVGDRLFRYDPALDKWVKQQAQGRDIIVRRVNE